jgi:hypothetical protein
MSGANGHAEKDQVSASGPQRGCLQPKFFKSPRKDQRTSGGLGSTV